MVSASTSPETFRVGLGQFRPSADVADNLRQIDHLVGQAATDSCQMVVFPEYSHLFSPDHPEHYRVAAEPTEGDFVQALQQMSRNASDMVIVAGMIERSSVGDAKPFNTLVVVQSGAVRAVSRKIHLFDAFGYRESDVFAPAPPVSPTVFDLGGWVFGLQTCYDIRFPEVSRLLIDQGAHVLVVPSQWVPGPHKLDQWRALLTARAIENQSWLIAVDHPESSGVGHSMVIDPTGQVVAELGADESFLTVELERTIVEQVRSANPMASARRLRVDWS